MKIKTFGPNRSRIQDPRSGFGAHQFNGKSVSPKIKHCTFCYEGLQSYPAHISGLSESFEVDGLNCQSKQPVQGYFI